MMNIIQKNEAENTCQKYKYGNEQYDSQREYKEKWLIDKMETKDNFDAVDLKTVMKEIAFQGTEKRHASETRIW